MFTINMLTVIMITNNILKIIQLVNLSIPGRGAAMIIESLRLFYHIRCFKCCVCRLDKETTIYTIYHYTLHALYVGYLVRRKYFYPVRSNCLLWCQTTFQAIVSFPRHETTLYPLFISDNGSRNKKTAMYLPPRAVKSFAPLQLGPKQYKSVI